MARRADPNRRADILIAAARMFSQKGYAATRIIEVARAAQVGKGTIYEYFPSKETLFFAVFEATMANTGAAIVKSMEGLSGDFSDRLQTLSDQVITTWLDDIHMYGLMMEFWAATASSPGRDRFKAAFRSGYGELRRMVGALIRKGRTRGDVTADCDVDAVAAALIGTWDALLLQAWLDPGFDVLGTSRAFLQVVLRGLGADPETAKRHQEDRQ